MLYVEIIIDISKSSASHFLLDRTGPVVYRYRLLYYREVRLSCFLFIQILTSQLILQSVPLWCRRVQRRHPHHHQNLKLWQNHVCLVK